MRAAAARPNASSRAASNVSLGALDELRGLLHLARELRLGLGERALRRLVEHAELLGAHAACRGGSGTSGRRRPPRESPKPSGRGASTRARVTACLLVPRALAELALAPSSPRRPARSSACRCGASTSACFIALDERRPDARRARGSAAAPRGGRSRGRRRCRAPWAGSPRTLCVPHDVVLNHHLGLGGTKTWKLGSRATARARAPAARSGPTSRRSRVSVRGWSGRIAGSVWTVTACGGTRKASRVRARAGVGDVAPRPRLRGPGWHARGAPALRAVP